MAFAMIVKVWFFDGSAGNTAPSAEAIGLVAARGARLHGKRAGVMHTAAGLGILAESRRAQVTRAPEPRDEMTLDHAERARLVVNCEPPVGEEPKKVAGRRPIGVEELKHAERRDEVLDRGDVSPEAERQLRS